MVDRVVESDRAVTPAPLTIDPQCPSLPAVQLSCAGVHDQDIRNPRRDGDLQSRTTAKSPQVKAYPRHNHKARSPQANSPGGEEPWIPPGVPERQPAGCAIPSGAQHAVAVTPARRATPTCSWILAGPDKAISEAQDAVVDHRCSHYTPHLGLHPRHSPVAGSQANRVDLGYIHRFSTLVTRGKSPGFAARPRVLQLAPSSRVWPHRVWGAYVPSAHPPAPRAEGGTSSEVPAEQIITPPHLLSRSLPTGPQSCDPALCCNHGEPLSFQCCACQRSCCPQCMFGTWPWFPRASTSEASDDVCPQCGDWSAFDTVALCSQCALWFNQQGQYKWRDFVEWLSFRR